MMYAMAESVRTAEAEEKRREEALLKEREAQKGKENRIPSSASDEGYMSKHVTQRSLEGSQRRKELEKATILHESINRLGRSFDGKPSGDEQSAPDILTQETDYGDFDIGTQDLGDLRRFF